MFSRRKVHLVILCVLIGLGGCSGGSDSGVEGDGDVVVWDNLKNLNRLLHEAEAYVDGNHMKELKEMIPELYKTSLATAENEIPKNIHHPDEVRVLLKDLSDIAQSLSDITPLSDAQLKAICESLHPIADKLFEVSGAPHTHDFEESNESDDHDHEDDHDH